MLGMFKGIFGKSAGTTQAPLSSAELKAKISEHEARIAQLRRQLPAEHVAESEKTAIWFKEMNVQWSAAKGKGDIEAAAVIEGKLKDAKKKQERIERHLEEINAQIVLEEDKIELLERQLDAQG